MKLNFLFKVNVQGSVILCLIIFSLTYNSSFGQGFNTHISSDRGEVMYVDNDNNNAAEDFVWCVDIAPSAWSNTSLNEKMRLSTLQLTLRTILRLEDKNFSMGSPGTFYIDAPGTVGGRFTVLPSGNTGIGTATPLALLDVRGTALIGAGDKRSDLGLTISAASTTAHALNSDVTDARRFLSLMNTSNTTNSYVPLTLRVGTTNPAMTDISLKRTADNTGSLFFTMRNGSSTYNDVMVMQSDGNVGIGTSSPTAKLDVNGNMKVSTGLSINVTTASNGGLSFYSSASYPYVSRIVDDGQLRLLTDDHFYIGSLSNTTGAATGNYTLYANVLTGNVGIGTTAPTQKLQVEGNGYFTGTMGIGTTPASGIQLKVKGSFDVTSSSDSTIFHVSTGKQLVFVGTSAYNQFLATQSNPTSDIQENNYSLWVSKGVVSEDYAIADIAEWDDYVFSQDYELPSLKSVAAFVAANKHLPNVPSEAEVKKNGYSLHTLNRGFLKTMEEMTLYAIEQEQKLEKQQAQIDAQQKEIDALKAQMATVLELLNKK
jgi:hypothetical protein